MRVLSLFLCTIATTSAAGLRRLRTTSSEEPARTITAKYLDLAGEVDAETIHRLAKREDQEQQAHRELMGQDLRMKMDTFAAHEERHLINRELQTSMSMMSMMSMSLDMRQDMDMSLSLSLSMSL